MIKENPSIIGVGRTKFGEHYEKEPEALIEKAWLRVSKETNIERRDLEACYISDYFLPITNKLGLEEGFLSELTELSTPMESTRSFSSALSSACNAILAGRYDVVLVGGIEKMSDRLIKIRDDLMLLEDPWSYYAGGTPEANHELMYRAYIKKYMLSKTEIEKLNIALAKISVKNHFQATKNEYAQYKRKITIEQVLNARKKAGRPLGLYDYAPISDGAVALILTKRSIANNFTSSPIPILGWSSATDYLTFSSRKDFTHFNVSKIAVNNALKMAKLNLWDIKTLELYDQSTFMEMISLEDLGFCENGKAWKYIYDSPKACAEGFYEINGKKLFVNTAGGLKAGGNPLGAAGGAQIFELYRQLTGNANERQIKSPEFNYGCALELVGFGTKGYIHILGRSGNE